ncbi:Uncharacterized protein OBRU01_25678, partial [Operophtera brumata]
MASSTEKFLLLICALFTVLKTVNSIHCYQCSGTDSINSFECNEFLESDVTLQAIDCGTLHDAQYCIKHVGRNEDLGNFCNYVQQPGDKLDYRTCIYTCDSDGCNSASAFRISAVVLALGVANLCYTSINPEQPSSAISWPPAQASWTPYLSLGREVEVMNAHPKIQQALFWEDIYAKHYRSPVAPAVTVPSA